MKLLCVLLFLIYFSCGISYAEEVLLDVNNFEFQSKNMDLNKYKYEKIDYEFDEKEYLKPSYKNIKRRSDDDYYKSKTISNKKEKNLGKINIGTKSDITLKPSEVSSSRTLYSDYELSKRMSVEGSYDTKTLGSLKKMHKGTVSGGMEYKLTKRTSIKNVYSKNLNDKSNKAEINLRFKPFKDDRFDMNIGAGQKLRSSGRRSSSQLNFGTNFRF